MYQLKKWLKNLEMEFCYLFVEILSIFFKKRKENLSGSNLRVGILFLKPLGFGDLIMLSPVIQSLAKIFQNSNVYLITQIPQIIKFENIKWVVEKEIKNQRFDLIISPTLNLHHLLYIFKTKFWLGYFGKSKIQSNFSEESPLYDPRFNHYILRGLNIVKILDKDKGNELQKQIKENKVSYPDLILEEPEVFKNLKDMPYLVIAPFSKWEERQWPFSYFSRVINTLLKESIVKKVVILGGKSDWEEKYLKEFLRYFEEKSILNLVGKLSLPESGFLIKNSFIYLGLDSGPSHFAYFLAKKPIVIFISVNPLNRFPLVKNIWDNIIYFHPENCPNFPCYSGVFRSDFRKCQKCALGIKPEKILEKIRLNI